MRPALLLLVLALAGCSLSVPVYKIDVQQGNVVDQDMIAKLKPGMTRAQVRYVLGSPLVVDPFRNDRWDYVYTLRKAGKLAEQRRVVLFFDGDVLKRIEGDIVPAGAAQPAGAAGEGQAAAKTTNP
jgi:outer membrane protein assembly factor BamE